VAFTAPSNPSFVSQSTAILSLPSLTLSDDESRLLQALIVRLFEQRPALILRGLYYDGLQKMQDLGISIPPALSGLRTIMGWPQIGVDAVEERLNVEGFRYPGAPRLDADLATIWQANDLDGESGLAHLDALIHGRSYITVGPGEDPEIPLITPESALNMVVMWDARLRHPVAALQIYLDTDFGSDMYGQEVAALYLPDRTIYMARDTVQVPFAAQGWEITERDNHNFGRVPVVRLANRQRIHTREGLSEITAAWMNTTDSACRTLLGMEVGREFHAAPRRYIVGASEEAFQNADGSPLDPWDAYMGKVWGITRDEDGNVPTVGTFAPSDPSVYTKLIDSYTQIMAGLTCLPPHFLGMSTQGNPASADAIRSSESRLIKRVQRKQIAFSDGWEETMRLALAIRGGAIPDGAERIETDWTDANTPTFSATTDAITKQVAAGLISSRSDVALKRLGYSAAERARIADELANDPAEAFLEDIGHTLAAKADRAAKGLIEEASQPVDPATETPPTPAAMPKQRPPRP
jgi:hypothetical protein